ncbi:hypothetical protein ACQ4PT_007074 [Festuca glaucescens]
MSGDKLKARAFQLDKVLLMAPCTGATTRDLSVVKSPRKKKMSNVGEAIPGEGSHLGGLQPCACHPLHGGYPATVHVERPTVMSGDELKARAFQLDKVLLMAPCTGATTRVSLELKGSSLSFLYIEHRSWKLTRHRVHEDLSVVKSPRKKKMSNVGEAIPGEGSHLGGLQPCACHPLHGGYLATVHVERPTVMSGDELKARAFQLDKVLLMAPCTGATTRDLSVVKSPRKKKMSNVGEAIPGEGSHLGGLQPRVGHPLHGGYPATVHIERPTMTSGDELKAIAFQLDKVLLMAPCTGAMTRDLSVVKSPRKKKRSNVGEAIPGEGSHLGGLQPRAGHPLHGGYPVTVHVERPTVMSGDELKARAFQLDKVLLMAPCIGATTRKFKKCVMNFLHV